MRSLNEGTCTSKTTVLLTITTLYKQSGLCESVREMFIVLRNGSEMNFFCCLQVAAADIKRVYEFVPLPMQ